MKTNIFLSDGAIALYCALATVGFAALSHFWPVLMFGLICAATFGLILIVLSSVVSEVFKRRREDREEAQRIERGLEEYDMASMDRGYDPGWRCGERR